MWKTQNFVGGWGRSLQTPLASGGWGLRSQTPGYAPPFFAKSWVRHCFAHPPQKISAHATAWKSACGTDLRPIAAAKV